MLLDLSTGRTRPLAPKLGSGTFRALRLSPAVSRAAVLTGESVIIEIDLGTGAEVDRFDAGGDQITGMTYVGQEIVAARWVWKGDLWTGRAPFH